MKLAEQNHIGVLDGIPPNGVARTEIGDVPFFGTLHVGQYASRAKPHDDAPRMKVQWKFLSGLPAGVDHPDTSVFEDGARQVRKQIGKCSHRVHRVCWWRLLKLCFDLVHLA